MADRVRKRPVPVCLAVAVVGGSALLGGLACSSSPSGPDLPGLGDYVLIGWNDLGMHCANRIFADLAVLPPYNNVWAVLIRRGEEPDIVGASYDVTYALAANTYSVGKTDFWSYEDVLFGVSLADNVGLAGAGLSGSLEWSGSPSGHYERRGIPVTPYDDANLSDEQPYQLAQLTAYDGSTVLAQTEIVVPVSNEMMCSNCHEPEDRETVDPS